MPGVPFGRPSNRWPSVRHRAAAEGSTKMSKSKKSKVVVFSLTMPKTEIPFATLRTSLPRFGAMRQGFEALGCRVEVVDVKA